MKEMTTPPMPKKKKSKMRQRISGRDGNSAMMDTAEQTKMNEMMKKRKPRPAPEEPVDGMMMGGKVKGYKTGGDLKMVEKDGKQVPFYAADGKGKMKAGGKVKKMMRGGPAGMYGESATEKQIKRKKPDDMMSGGMKKGGKVKMKAGGKVRGAGCAQRGVRPAKMR